MGILDAASFPVSYTVHTLKGYTPGQLVFVRDMVLPIKTYMKLEINTST